MKMIVKAALIACLAVPALAADSPAPEKKPDSEVGYVVMREADYERMVYILKFAIEYIETQRVEIGKLKSGRCV